MTEFTCETCGAMLGDVRLVEHGRDDIALCKRCFRNIKREVACNV